MAEVAFITGGAGFIGSRLARRLAAASYDVVVFDNLHPQVHGEGATVPNDLSGAHFVRGDVTDSDSLKKAVADCSPDIVFHLAAETGTGQSFDEPTRYSAVNVLGTTHLIEAIRQSASKTPKVILAGSRAVYGEGAYRTPDGRLIPGPERCVEAMARGEFDPRGPDGCALEPAPTPESLPLTPASVYASTKLMQEYLLTQCSADGAFEPVVLRFQNVYGPGQSLRNPYTGVLSIFASQILNGRRLNIFEDGNIVRDFVYVDDVVDALIMATASKPLQGPVNIGSGYPATIIECAQTLLSALGAEPDGFDVTGDFRAGDIRHALADVSKASNQLDWSPKTPLEKGLKALADWAAGQQQDSA